MLKDAGNPFREPARRRAERMWRNYDVEKRFKQAKAKPSTDSDPGAKGVEIVETIKNEELKKGTITRAQTKFARYIKKLLDGHKKRNEQRNLIVCAISIRAQRKRLLLEKLRRLEARHAPQNQEESNV